jgi:chitodextrinase
MVGGSFQVSSDAGFTNPVTVYTIFSTPADGYTSISLVSPVSGRYVRYVAPGNSYGNVAEVEFDGPAPAPDTQAPTVPGTPTVGAGPTSSTLTLTWTASTDNVAVDHYIVYRNGTQVGTPITNTFPDTALTANTTYSYTVKAVDTSGNMSAVSASLAVTTLPASAKLGGTVRDKAFDGDTATYFDSASASGNWVGLDLGGQYALSSIRYAPRVTSGGYNYEARMVGGIFQASNTADFSSGVVDLYTVSAQPADGYTSQTVSAAGSYRYVRYLAPANSWGNIAEVEFYGTPALPTWVSSTSVATWNPATSVLTVTGATTITADPGAVLPTIIASGLSAVVTVNTTSDLKIHLGGLSLSNGASLTLASLGVARTEANHRVLVIGSASATSAPTFSIDATSTLDLTDNDLIDLYGGATSPMAGIRGQIQQASDGGLWDQTGLTSSIVKNGPSGFALGYAEASVLNISTFDGQALGGNAVLVKYTRPGDTNLQGSIGLADYTTVIRNYGVSSLNWTDGNYDFATAIGLSDYTDVILNYGITLT